MSLSGPPANFSHLPKRGLVIGVTQTRFADVELLTFLTPNLTRFQEARTGSVLPCPMEDSACRANFD
jgi:hypothetical protein